MKILELRFKNLNSLYGEWHIDFTESEYVYNGIFALTGPTGAGKSTILDAICLALYGSTPRLGRITQSSNDIMSRQTGECYAEVVFASQAGTFRCHWAQHRSRKNADGELQSPRHEISEANAEGKIIENQLKSVLGAVEEKTGMDFDRFTRSILLAQGGFDTFLKATVEQKSRILEQITGTKIYSDISIGVHERLREEKTLLTGLEAETRGILILTAEEEQAVEEEHKLAQQQEKSLEALVSDLSKAVNWLKDLEQLEKEIKVLADEEQILSQAFLAFEPERSDLDQASKAATLEGVYATLSGLRKQQQEDQASLTKEADALPRLETEARLGSECLGNAERQTEQAKTAQQEAVPTLKQVRALDQKLEHLAGIIDESTTSIGKDVTTIGKFTALREVELQKVSDEQDKLDAIETYFAEHAADKELIFELTGILGQLEVLHSKQMEVGKKEKEEQRAAKALDVAETALIRCIETKAVLQERHSAISIDIQTNREALQTILGEYSLSSYRAEKDALLHTLAYQKKIVELEAYRLKLEDGKACPLCGSMEHPFALGNIPVPDETETKIGSLTQIISQAEDLEKKRYELDVKERVASKAMTEQKQLESDSQHTKSSASIAYTSAKEEFAEAKQTVLLLEKGVADKLAPYGIAEIPRDVQLLEDSLSSRKETWQNKEAEKKDIERNISTIKGELQRLDGIIATHESALHEKEEILKALGISFANVKTARFELYGCMNTDNEEENLAKAVRDAEAREREARKAYSDLLQKVRTAEDRIKSLKTSLAKRKPLLETQNALFLEELVRIGFSDEQQFLSAILSLVERNHLASKAKALDDRQTALKAKQKDRTTRLESEQAKHLTEKSLPDLQPLLEKEEDELKIVREAIAGCKARIRANSEAKLRIESKQESIERQRKECAKWDKLHSLIGSSDGKKFRNFAQGLTFELMVSHANRQLSKMSDRYLLIRSEEQPLELNVIDNYQGGEIRSTKNLSGGESFIVSLTLALGLSKMASRKVRVDSLFLDEGFGTLDEASLETALKTLSSLHQDGKLIGVISHVSAMQDLISTQITITPASGGRSILTGPGCRKVNP